MSEIQSDTTRIAKNSLYMAMRMAVVMIISIFTTRYLLANLGVEDYGVYNVTIGIVAMCSFLMPAFSSAMQRYYNFENETHGVEGAKKVFNTGLIIQLLFIVFFVAICETAGLWYVNNKLVYPEGRDLVVFWVFQLAVFSFSLSVIQIPFLSSIISHERMGFYALVTTLDAVFKLGIAIGIAYSSFDHLLLYSILLTGITLLDFFLYAGYSIVCFKEIRLQLSFDKALFKKLLSFSGWTVFETLARMGKDQGLSLLLNRYFGPILNAARGVASQVSNAFAGLVDSTVMSAKPQMVNSYARGEERSTLNLFFTLSKGALFLVLFLGLPVFLELDYILMLWLGVNIPDYAAIFVRISIIIVLVDKLASPVTALIHATGKVSLYHSLSGLINIAVIPVAWIVLAITHSPVSVYIVTFAAALFAQVVFLFIIRRLLCFSIKEYVQTVCVPFFRVVVVAWVVPVVIYCFMPMGLPRLLIVLMTSFLFTGSLVLLWGITPAEKEILTNVARNIVPRRFRHL